MPFVGVTRLRIRSIRFLPSFVRHFLRTRKQVRQAPGFQGGSLVLLCHFLVHQRPLLSQTAGTSGQRFDQSDGQLTADACD
jgi:hypothetical protein